MYVFDTSSFSALFKFYPKIFPSLWEKIDHAVANGHIISVSEAYVNYKNETVTKPINEWLVLTTHLPIRFVTNYCAFIVFQIR